MQIRRMTAAFGKLQEQTLELQDGLNILQAPNEADKSTWCAFLLSMFYGVSAEERDQAGAPISGRLDCRSGDDSLTLSRATRRQAAPMGDFQALYTGTADPVPGLTGANCGETLLGVSREVYARSAFIRQGGALTASGEEDDGFSEAAEVLKKQLSRSSSKTGQLPALEAELQETEAALASQAELVRQRENLTARAAGLEAQEDALKIELAGLERWDVQQKRLELQKAEEAALRAEEKAAALRRRLEEEQIPENNVTGRLRGAIVNLGTARKSAEKAQEEYQAAKAALAKAEEALSASPFAGQTAEEARRTAQDPLPGHKRPLAPALVTALLGLCATGAAGYGVYFYYMQNLYAALGTAGAVLAAALLVLLLVWKRTGKKSKSAALMARYGTSDLSEITALADAYIQQLDHRDAAKGASSAKAAAAKSLWESVDSNASGILEQVRRFAPAAYDIPSADAALRASALLRRELAEAENAAKAARLRADLQAQQIPAPPEGSPEPVQPSRGRSREAVLRDLESVRTDLSTLRSSLDRIDGRLHAAGDPLALQAQAEQLTEEIAILEKESAAIELAMSPLARANTRLQGRFSPALGQRAAEIFDQLTDSAPRGAGCLSAGDEDQLYLAVHLAVCDLVLPAPVPIVLDDALASFDSQRCASALAYLRREAEKRQILLFTRRSREAKHFRDDPAVSVQRLNTIS